MADNPAPPADRQPPDQPAAGQQAQIQSPQDQSMPDQPRQDQSATINNDGGHDDVNSTAAVQGHSRDANESNTIDPPPSQRPPRPRPTLDESLQRHRHRMDLRWRHPSHVFVPVDSPPPRPGAHKLHDPYLSALDVTLALASVQQSRRLDRRTPLPAAFAPTALSGVRNGADVAKLKLLGARHMPFGSGEHFFFPLLLDEGVGTHGTTVVKSGDEDGNKKRKADGDVPADSPGPPPPKKQKTTDQTKKGEKPAKRLTEDKDYAGKFDVQQLREMCAERDLSTKDAKGKDAKWITLKARLKAYEREAAEKDEQPPPVEESNEAQDNNDKQTTPPEEGTSDPSDDQPAKQPDNETEIVLAVSNIPALGYAYIQEDGHATLEIMFSLPHGIHDVMPYVDGLETAALAILKTWLPADEDLATTLLDPIVYIEYPSGAVDSLASTLRMNLVLAAWCRMFELELPEANRLLRAAHPDDDFFHDVREMIDCAFHGRLDHKTLRHYLKATQFMSQYQDGASGGQKLATKPGVPSQTSVLMSRVTFDRMAELHREAPDREHMKKKEGGDGGLPPPSKQPPPVKVGLPNKPGSNSDESMGITTSTGAGQGGGMPRASPAAPNLQRPNTPYSAKHPKHGPLAAADAGAQLRDWSKHYLTWRRSAQATSDAYVTRYDAYVRNTDSNIRMPRRHFVQVRAGEEMLEADVKVAIASVWKPLLALGRGFALASSTATQVYRGGRRPGLGASAATAGREESVLLLALNGGLNDFGLYGPGGRPRAELHHVLVVAEVEDPAKPYKIRLTKYDSSPGFAPKESIFEIATNIARNCGWLKKGPKDQVEALEMEVTRKFQQPVPGQWDPEVCGIHVVLNAWCVMLGIPIRPPHIFGERPQPDHFYDHARLIITAACAGLVTTLDIEAFMHAMKYTTDTFKEDGKEVVIVQTVHEDDASLGAYMELFPSGRQGNNHRERMAENARIAAMP